MLDEKAMRVMVDDRAGNRAQIFEEFRQVPRFASRKQRQIEPGIEFKLFRRCVGHNRTKWDGKGCRSTATPL
jgi:hypothetical protein